MHKIKWGLFSLIVILLVVGGIGTYQKATDNTYEGMSIIPEQHDDIPLFKGLEPDQSQYAIEGDRWQEISDYYSKKLPKLGWSNVYMQTALDDDDPENDWGGFYSRWKKSGFDGELSVYGSYNEFDDQTEVMFDKTPIVHVSTWIKTVPESICIYKSPTDRSCTEINDKEQIQQLVNFINEAPDWDKKALPHKKESIIDFR
ncbi:hypothetical protein [Bacillus sp. FJAT-27245]|uniref:hypothetical protein n=1 Tax=Bacillus sp. FJAT-27245 TaxID=1684144 RepID=UPI0006A79256|nr:hypothetical protein [Bacillus sp. FJAT-27245]